MQNGPVTIALVAGPHPYRRFQLDVLAVILTIGSLILVQAVWRPGVEAGFPRGLEPNDILSKHVG